MSTARTRCVSGRHRADSLQRPVDRDVLSELGGQGVGGRARHIRVRRLRELAPGSRGRILALVVAVVR